MTSQLTYLGFKRNVDAMSALSNQAEFQIDNRRAAITEGRKHGMVVFAFRKSAIVLDDTLTLHSMRPVLRGRA